MSKFPSIQPDPTVARGAADITVTRRSFVQGLALGGAVLGLGLQRSALAAPSHIAAPAVLSGTQFDLAIGAGLANFTGRSRAAITINGSLPAPVLRLREGDHVTFRVRNELPETTSIHWHGLLLPNAMDGVPGMTFDGIKPGETFSYHFPIRQSGTYWYHGHSGMQELLGLYGAMVIEPRAPEPFRYDRDYVVMLSDWTDDNPTQVFHNLKKQSDYYNLQQRTVGDFFRDVRQQGWRAAVANRKMWGEMRMNPTDLADVSAVAFTYLVNGVPPAGNWTGLFKPGEKVRLRFINGAAMTYFDVRIPGLRMTVVAADGQYVHPVDIEEFRLGGGETLDVIVKPAEQQAYTIFAQNMDRSGFARATLAVQAGLSASVPAVDPRPILTMADMGHEGHGSHGAHPGVGGNQAVAPGKAGASELHDHSQMQHDMTADSMSGMMDMRQDEHSGPDMGAMAGMAGMAGISHEGHAMSGMEHAAQASSVTNPHARHQAAESAAAGSHAGHGADGPGMQAHPASEERNPGVDMQASSPSTRLDDPGVGLRDNGRRVLTYADLKSAFPDPDGREPMREIELHLTGNMERYLWSVDGIPFSEAMPIRLNYGERVRITLVNDTMMEHPFHLHGMWSDLEDEKGNFQVRKHTISMPPGTRRSYRVTADAPGRWAYHCHLFFHMAGGMMREVRVEKGGA